MFSLLQVHLKEADSEVLDKLVDHYNLASNIKIKRSAYIRQLINEKYIEIFIGPSVGQE